MSTQRVLALVGDPLQLQLSGARTVVKTQLPVAHADILVPPSLLAKTALTSTVELAQACDWSGRDDHRLEETCVAGSVAGRTIPLEGNAGSSSDAGPVLPASTGGKGGTTVAVAEVPLEDGTVCLGDFALRILELDLASQVADTGRVALLGHGLAV